MISQDGYAKILDFDLAKLIETESDLHRAQQHKSIQGIILGTLGYMSPEQTQGKAKIDARSDIFSFGCILYEAIARRKPFVANSTFDALNEIIHAEPEPFNSSSELQEIVLKCLEKSPSERFQTIKEVAECLKKIDHKAIESSKNNVSPATLKVTRTLSKSISEQRRQTTILFADLSDLSEMLEELDPEESDEIMQDLFSSFNEKIEQGKGKIEKTA